MAKARGPVGGVFVRVAAAGLLTAALVGIAVVAIQAGSAGAAFPGAQGWIVFDQLNPSSGLVEIQRINPDGTLPVRLTEDGSDPAFSPDTKKLALVRGGDIYKLNANGRRLIRLSRGGASDFDPAWSADGERIVFARRRGDSDAEIYSIKANGKKQRRLTDNSVTDRHPAWSPSGKRIAFSRGGKDFDIRTMKPNGKKQKRLTGGAKRSDSRPNWSPDGKTIAFAATSGAGASAIYTMRANGKQRRIITSGALGGDAPAFSPDGSLILFEGIGATGPLGIYVMRPDGTEPRRLALTGSNPDWQPR
ncbi:MAG: hypothetical protein WBC01_00040 [Solirubrobacterales bacterium]